MNIDKFGHHVYKKRKMDITKPLCVMQTNKDHLDAENKVIKNCGHPVDLNDSVTKKYVDEIEKNISKKITELSQILTQLSSQSNNTKSIISNIKSRENEQRKRGK